SGRGRPFRQQTRLGHSGNRVHFENEWLVGFGQKNVHPSVNFQAEGAKCRQRQLLNFFRQRRIDLRRTDMLRARASLRIQERVLGIEVVKTALRNYFKNRQGLITEDTYRQFAPRYKFFYQQFAIVLGRFFYGRIDLVFVFHDHDPDRRSLPRRFYHQRHGHFRTPAGVDHFRPGGDDVVLQKFLLRQNLVERDPAFLDAVAGVGNAALFQNFLDLSVFAESSVIGVEAKIYIFRERKVFVPDVDIDHVDPERAQRLGNAATGRERNVSLRSRAAHQHRNFFR